MAYYIAYRSQLYIDMGRGAIIEGTLSGAAWPTMEAALRSRPKSAVEYTVVDARSLWPRRRIAVCPEDQVEAELQRLVDTGHIEAPNSDTPKC